MNEKYYQRRIENSPLGSIGLDLLKTQRKLICQEYEIENLRLKAAYYKASFFHEFTLAEKLQKQITENKDALTGEFDGFCYASWRAAAIFRTLDDLYEEGFINKEEYGNCGLL